MDVQNHHQITSKSRNLWLFVKIWKKINMSRQAVFCPNFLSTPTSTKYPIQIDHIHLHSLDNWSQQSISWHHISLDICQRVTPKMQIAPYISSNFVKISIYLLRNRVWSNLHVKQLWYKIKRGPSILPPILFQFGKLEGDIWTFEQIDELPRL